ncbi:hypothetical protein OG21DRAFT_1510001 [Imleria badia]|nr:hypothetical protein OG21DRAFT_1510001 [Imleria badia]
MFIYLFIGLLSILVYYVLYLKRSSRDILRVLGTLDPTQCSGSTIEDSGQLSLEGGSGRAYNF